LGYKWVTKNRGFAVNQALLHALLPNTFSKQAAKKPQGPVTLLEVTHLACLRSLSRSWVGLSGPGALGHVFGKRFVVGRYEFYYSSVYLCTCF